MLALLLSFFFQSDRPLLGGQLEKFLPKKIFFPSDGEASLSFLPWKTKQRYIYISLLSFQGREKRERETLPKYIIIYYNNPVFFLLKFLAARSEHANARSEGATILLIFFFQFLFSFILSFPSGLFFSCSTPVNARPRNLVSLSARREKIY